MIAFSDLCDTGGRRIPRLQVLSIGVPDFSALCEAGRNPLAAEDAEGEASFVLRENAYCALLSVFSQFTWPCASPFVCLCVLRGLIFRPGLQLGL